MAQPIAVLFDIDGTLISTGGAGARAWRWAFDKLHGVPADIGEFSDAGMTDPQVLRLTFEHVLEREPTAREVAALMQAYLTILPDEVTGSEGYEVLDGAPEALADLCERGVLLGIVTGAVEAAAHVKLGRARLNHFFAFGGYGSDSADRVELTRKALDRGGALLGSPLDPAEVLVIGDTPKDVEAALAVGAVAVGVASHHFDEQALRAAGAEHVLHSLRDPLPL